MELYVANLWCGWLSSSSRRKINSQDQEKRKETSLPWDLGVSWNKDTDYRSWLDKLSDTGIVICNMVSIQRLEREQRR
jgi:hypothetical protein